MLPCILSREYWCHEPGLCRACVPLERGGGKDYASRQHRLWVVYQNRRIVTSGDAVILLPELGCRKIGMPQRLAREGVCSLRQETGGKPPRCGGLTRSGASQRQENVTESGRLETVSSRRSKAPLSGEMSNESPRGVRLSCILFILSLESLARVASIVWILGFLIPFSVLVGSASVAILCNERRPLVLLSLGGPVGLVMTGIVLAWLALLVGIAAAVWVTLIFLVSGGLAALVYWRRLRLLRGEPLVTRRYVVVLCVLAIHFGVVGAVSWQHSVGAGSVAYTLHADSALTTTIARGNFPVVNPYQPDYLLAFHLAYHLLGAFVTRLADQSAPQALTWLNAALFAFLYLGAVGLGQAARLGAWRTLLAATLTMAIGAPYWVGLPRVANIDNPSNNSQSVVTTLLPEAPLGTLGANALTVTGNMSLVYGYLILICVLALYVYTWRAQGVRRTLLALATGATLGYLVAPAESVFVPLAAALLVDIAVRLLFVGRPSSTDLLRFAGASGAMLITALTSPGIVFARVFGDAVSDPGIQINHAHLFQLVSIRRVLPLHFIPSLESGLQWSTLNSAEIVWELGFLLLLIPLALFYTWRTRERLSFLLLLFSGACFSAALLFTTSKYPADMTRMVSVGTVSFAFVAGLAAVWFLTTPNMVNLLLKRVALGALLFMGVLAMGGFVLRSLALPWLADPRPPVEYRPDVEAATSFLQNETAVHERLLVLGGSDHFLLNRETQAVALWLTSYVVAYSGQFLPTGFDVFTQYEAYVQEARSAQRTLSAADLRALEVAYLYAPEPWLDDVQRAALAEKWARGALARVWQAAQTGESGACRAFFRVNMAMFDGTTTVTYSEAEGALLPNAPVRLQIPALRPAGTERQSAAPGSPVQATFLIIASEPTTLRVDYGAGFSLRLPIERALAVRTPPVATGSTLTLHTERGTARVLWLETYMPAAPHGAEYSQEELALCSEA